MLLYWTLASAHQIQQALTRDVESATDQHVESLSNVSSTNTSDNLMSLLHCISAGGQLKQYLSNATVHMEESREDFIPLTTMNVLNHVGQIRISGQLLPAVYDTGSWDNVCLSTKCESCTCGVTLAKMLNLNYSALYDPPKNSTTYTQSDVKKLLSYGSGDVTAALSFDTVKFAGHSVENVPLWQVLEHSIAAWTGFSCIAGLGRDSVGETGNATMLDLAHSKTFSICLSQHGGYVAFGSHTKNSVKKVSAVDVVGNHHWVVNLEEMTIKNNSVCRNGTKCVALIDSGTSLIMMSRNLIQDLGLVDLIAEDCSNIDTLPTFYLNIGNQTLSLPPSVYVIQIFGQATPDWGHYFQSWARLSGHGALVSKKSSVICMPAIMVADEDRLSKAKLGSEEVELVILGMNFFHAYKTTFDRETPAVYFTKVENCDGSRRSYLRQKKMKLMQIDASKTQIRRGSFTAV